VLAARQTEIAIAPATAVVTATRTETVILAVKKRGFGPFFNTDYGEYLTLEKIQ